MRRFLLMLIVVMLVLSLGAVAQEFPRVQGFLGYAYARNQIQGPTAYNFNGWNGEVTVNGNRFFGVTGSISGQYHQVKDGPPLDAYHFLFGPQFTYRNADSKVAPFGRILLGASKYKVADASQTEFSYGFGGGLDVKLATHIAARVFQADYIRTHFANDHQNNVRLSFGISIMGGNSQ